MRSKTDGLRGDFMKHLLTSLVAGFLCAYSLAGYANRPLRLSMLPLYSSGEIDKRIRPLADYLGSAIGSPVEPVIASDFKTYQQRLSRDIDIGFENPVVYVRSSHEALAVVFKERYGSRFRGLIITRADSSIVSMNELKGKRVSIVSRTSAGGYLSQSLSLAKVGIDAGRDLVLEDALDNKQENVILSTYNGDVDAGFVRESALHAADKYVPSSQLRIIQRTAYMPEWVLSVRSDLPEKTKLLIRKALLDLHDGSPVLKALNIMAFKEASDQDYDVIRKALGLPIPSR